MKYLRKFASLSEYNTAKSGQNFWRPCVSLISGDMSLEYDKTVTQQAQTPQD